MGRAAAEQGYDAQARALEDGVVSEAELRISIAGTVDCWRAAGLEAGEYREIETLTGIDFMAEFEPGAVPPAQAGAVADRCEDEHRTAVSSAWSLQESRLTAKAKALLDSCFERAGLSGGDASTIEAFQEVAGDDVDLWVDCLTEAGDAIRGDG